MSPIVLADAEALSHGLSFEALLLQWKPVRLQESEFPVQDRERIEGVGDQGPSMMVMVKPGSLKEHRTLKVWYTYSGTCGHG